MAAEGMRKQYSGNMLSDPKVISKAISKVVKARRPKARYTIGFMAKPLVWLHNILPARWFDYIMMHASLSGSYFTNYPIIFLRITEIWSFFS